MWNNTTAPKLHIYCCWLITITTWPWKTNIKLVINEKRPNIQLNFIKVFVLKILNTWNYTSFSLQNFSYFNKKVSIYLIIFAYFILISIRKEQNKVYETENFASWLLSMKEANGCFSACFYSFILPQNVENHRFHPSTD